MALPVIPATMQFKDTNEILSENFKSLLNQWRGIEKLLTKGEKAQIEKLEKLRSLTEKWKKNEELIQKSNFDPQAKKTLLLRNKLIYLFYKYTNNKFFQKILSGVTTIAKGIADMAKNSFMKLLGFLMMMAIFDPKGNLLRTILKFIINMAVWLIKTLATMLPTLIKTMADLISNVFPSILRDIVTTFFPELGRIFRKLSKDLEKDFPVLSWIVGLLGDAFGPDGILYKFGISLSKMLPVLVAGFLILGAIMKFAPVLMTIFTVLKWIFIIVKFVIMGIVSLVSFIGIIPTLIIAAIIVVGLLIWKYWDNIKAFFIMIGNYIVDFVVLIKDKIFSFFGLIGSYIAKFALLIFDKIMQIGSFIIDIVLLPIKTLYKFSQKFIKEALKLFAKIGKMLWDSTTKIFSGILKAVFKPMQFIFDAFKAIANVLAPVVKPLLNALNAIWDLVKEKIIGAFNWVKRTFQYFIDMFKAISTFGIVDYFSASSEEKEAMITFVQYANVKGWDLDEMEDEKKLTPEQKKALEAAGVYREVGGEFGGVKVTRQTSEWRAKARKVIDQSPQYSAGVESGSR